MFPYGSLSGAIILQFEDEGSIRHVNHGISPTYRTILLHFNVGSHQIEYQIEDGLEVSLVLIGQAIGNACQICLEAKRDFPNRLGRLRKT